LELLNINAIIYIMHRFVFILMIALLPLQGWTSVAMSTEMATMQLASSQSRSVDKPMEMSPECALRMSAASSQDAENNDASNQVCSDCQACHLIALTEPLQIVNKATFSVSFERPTRHYFASADLQLNQKPPIFLA
jgi:hypothetical protein